MTKYATNNPLGSMDPKDLFDNAQNLDFAVNDITKAFWKDRFGRTRPTMYGMEQSFSAQLLSQQQRFNNFIQNSGYKVIGEYTAGPLTITDYNQLIRYQDAFWKLTASTNIPFTTTGSDAASWANDSVHFFNVGDGELRQELDAPGGAGLVGGVAKPVTWSGFAGGADATGVATSDAAFAAAAAFEGEVYIPAGKYNIATIYRGNFSCAEGVEFIGGGYVMTRPRPLWPTAGNPSVITRFSRLAIGDTAFDLGPAKASPQMSWLGQKDYVAPNGSLQPNLGWIEQNARGSSYASEGSIGFAGAAHSKNQTGGASIGLVGVGVNDNETYSVNTWALYLDAKRYPGAGTTWGTEIAVANHGPYIGYEENSAGKTFGIALAAGADPKINGNTSDCTQAIKISNNGASWGSGIAFDNSLRTYSSEPGIEAYGKALVLRNSNRIGWEDAAGNTQAFVTSKVSDITKRTGMTLRNGAVDLEGNGLHILRVSYAPGDNGYFRVFSASDANPIIRLGTEGIANCSVQLEAAGTGEITVNRDFRPREANARKCGTTAFPWSGGATQTAFAVTSDARYKTLISDISDILIDIWEELQYKTYKFTDRVEAKGNDARWHLGLVTQDVDAAFAKHGLNARDYALFCHDVWDDQHERIQLNEGEMTTRTRMIEVPKTTQVEIDGEMVEVAVGHYEVRETSEGEKEVWVCEFVEVEEEYEDFADPIYEQRLILPAGDRYSLRYEEALALEAALHRRNHERLLAKYADLASRIEALESK
ncbi:tail fiber domain-containing protein [Leclercia adecarboxylata]|uniref:tail fiber domain-containing protein n=1 Tax=Leclercia adecarboxylata TaxID=83655 RepID=UPI0013DF9A75|nr:tail fiber domain-containing protein [Leclercia adecarboxylata]QIG28452.1 tail fiber domain-containing protein [Leclercia adecarboxylata]